MLAIEQQLIRKLPSIFSLDFIYNLSDEATLRLAGESPEMTKERAQMLEKLEVLTDGLAQLAQLSKGPLLSVRHRKLSLNM